MTRDETWKAPLTWEVRQGKARRTRRSTESACTRVRVRGRKRSRTMTLPASLSSVFVRALTVLFVCLSGVATAFAEQTATLSVTILIVDEREACPPNGYRPYGAAPGGGGAEAPRQCPIRLDVSDVERWIEDDVLRDDILIPPRNIPVGRLLPFLRRYINTNNIDLNSRRAAVFVFEWSEPQFFDLSFRRESNFEPLDPITFAMRGHRHWIHHERADSLAPINGVVWVLATGDEEMRLTTTGGSDGR